MTTHSYGSEANSPDAIWQITDKFEQNIQTSKVNGIAQKRSSAGSSSAQLKLEANMERLKSLLDSAPLLQERKSGTSGVRIFLPLASGEYESFEVFENPIIKPLNIDNSSEVIKTFKAFSESGSSQAHLDYGPRGFHAMISGTDGSFFIDPDMNSLDTHQKLPSSYHGFLKTDKTEFNCKPINSLPEPQGHSTLLSKPAARSSGRILRNYDLAVVATPAYANVFTDNFEQDKSKVYSAMVTAVNRVNLVFNQDLAINLNLIDAPDLIFLDETDPDYPFTGEVSQDLWNITQVINDSSVGANGYDVGHMFTQSTTGIARIRSVCNNSYKGAGISGVGNTAQLESDYFYIDFLAHELGHQFGANHTFNATSGFCETERNAATAVEPGSGSTIMSYAGICPPQNIQGASNDYFHDISINEILNHVESQSCETPTGSLAVPVDNPPDIYLDSSSIVIPANTPFFLSAFANDIDGTDIFYSWEQTDTGSATRTLNELQSDSGSNPLFRSSKGGANQNTRFFPSFQSVVDPQTYSILGDTYPETSRTLNFTANARSAPYGRDSVSMEVNVKAHNTGFLLIHPFSGNYYSSNQYIQLYWETANSELSPIACDTVSIAYSDSNSLGITNYIELVTNVTNDGFHTLSELLDPSTNARFLIRCENNNFYTLGTGSFNIVSDDTSFFSVTSDIQSLQEGNSGEKTITFTVSRSGNISSSNSIDYNLDFSDSITGSDYSAVSNTGTLTLASNEVSKTIKLYIKGDTEFETDEQIALVISNPQSGYVSKSFEIISIINDDEKEKDKKGGGGGSLYYLLLLIGLITSTRKLFFPIVILYIFTFGACSPLKNTEPDLHPQVQELLWVENANPSRDVEKNYSMNGNNTKFLAISLKGRAQIPGLVEEDLEQAMQHGYIIQAGMGEVIFSDRHMHLREQFFIYANEYNQLLAKKLFN